jgi:hypothetical protein
VLDQLDHLKVMAQTTLARPPPDSELRFARAYDLGTDIGSVKRVLFVRPGSRIAYLHAHRVSEGYGVLYERWSRLDLTQEGKSDPYADALGYARSTYQASNMFDHSLQPYFTKDLTSLPGQVRAALTIMQAAYPTFECGIIRDNWQGKFNWYTVVAYDRRNGRGAGESFGPEGKSLGRFPLHPR